MMTQTFSPSMMQRSGLKKHGLQMSFGVGGEDGRSTRVRVDYRWHDESLDDISLQIEIPFQ